MINIAIVDDSKTTRDFINQACYEYYKTNNNDFCVETFHNGTLLLDSKRQYDLIFLDIELGIDNGIDIAKRFRKRDKQALIVIISGHEKYKQSAYSIHCFDYIDKPITKDKVYSVLKEIGLYRQAYYKKETITLKTLQGTKKIYLSSIIYCEYKERKVFIHTLSQSYDLYMPLLEVYNKLKQKGFGMCHRAFIVNFEKISLINYNEILLENSMKLHISKSKRQEFLKEFENYLQGGI